MERFQFLFKQRTSSFQPTFYFRENIREREVGYSRLKTGQYRNDGASSFRSPGGLAGASPFAYFRFPTHIAFTAIVGWLDFWMRDKHEQAIDVFGEFVFQKNEC